MKRSGLDCSVEIMNVANRDAEKNEALRQESIKKYGYDPDNDGCWECGRKGHCNCWG
jgi:hypothetical protein